MPLFVLIPMGLQAQVEADSLAADSASAVPIDPRQLVMDSLKASSDLTAQVKYSAEDSIVFDVKNNILTLHRSANLDYDMIQLKAMDVEIALDEQTLYARGRENARGELEGKPEFTESGETYEAREVAYNFKSQKGRVVGARAAQADGYVLASVAKYHPDGSFHGKSGKYTTCDKDPPHFYINSRKIKITADNKIISGPLNLVIADVPIPIVLPFGMVPNQKGQRSGLLLPDYGEAADRGFYFRGLGYYWYINDNWDLLVNADIYTKGGWLARAASRYNVRYKYQGGFTVEYGISKFNEKTDPDFSKTSAWRVLWNHNQPINRTLKLTSSVNFSSSATFQRDISFRPPDYFQNDLASSVSMQKSFSNLPFDMNLNLSHRQDLNKGTMTLDLPSFTFNVNRINPFKQIKGKGLEWLRLFGFNYQMRLRNNLQSVPDTLFFDILLNPNDSVTLERVVGGDTVLVTQPGSDFFKAGIQHTTSASTSIKLFKYINLAPNFNYTEVWYPNTIRKYYDPVENQVVTYRVPGFDRGFYFAGGVSASTNFFGIYQLPNTRKQIAFRQRFTPTVSYTYRPDFSDPQWGFYDTVQRDSLGNTLVYSKFEEGLFGGPRSGESQAISFGVSSVLEMKSRSKESFKPDFEGKEQFKRSTLIDNMGISSSYNMAADSFNLAPFSLRVRSTILNRMININATAILDPYQVEYQDPGTPETEPSNPRRVNKFMIVETGKLGRITRAQFSLNARFSSKQKKGKKKDPQESSDFDQAFYGEINRTLRQYVDFDIPWSANVRYNFSYNRPLIATPVIVQTLNVDGDFSFTPNWKIGISSGFDFQKTEITQTRFSVFRDLHCWELSFSWIPFGPLQSYSLTINVKSPVLRDLRLSKNSNWQDGFRPF